MQRLQTKCGAEKVSCKVNGCFRVFGSVKNEEKFVFQTFKSLQMEKTKQIVHCKLRKLHIHIH